MPWRTVGRHGMGKAPGGQNALEYHLVSPAVGYLGYRIATMGEGESGRALKPVKARVSSTVCAWLAFSAGLQLHSRRPSYPSGVVRA